MKVVTSVSDMINLSHTFRSAGKKIAFVPTMGALHAGHLSLLEKARECSDISILSIFVNPTQFGQGEDFEKYPRPIEDDRKKAEENGCDILFAPTAKLMYPESYMTVVSVKDITGKLCGISRPTHFDGVTTIVLKLLNIVFPHYAIFGAKDAQQVIVIKRMLVDLHHQTEIIVNPIVRENNGLAISSRNVYLTEKEREEAIKISQALQMVNELYENGERTAGVLKEKLLKILNSSGLIIVEYAEIVDFTTLEPVKSITEKVLVAIACRMNESNTRLIDNTVLGGTL